MLWELAENYLLNLLPEFSAIDKNKKLDKNEILELYLPLVFIAIGIEALRKEADLEHAVLGQKTLEKEILEHIKPKHSFINKEFDIKKMDL